MLPLREKVFVRLPRDLAAALERYVEKRVHETPGIRLTRSDVIRACLHRSLQAELHELAMHVEGTDMPLTKYSSSSLSIQNQAALAGTSAITFATDFVDQVNGCAC